MAKAGVRDIAKLAEVSLATVSRVLNQHPNVSAALRRRVLRVAEELGYTANRSARRGQVTMLVEGFADLRMSKYHAAMIGPVVTRLAAAGLRPDVIPIESLDMLHLSRQYTEAVLALVWSTHCRKLLHQLSNAPVIVLNDYSEYFHCVYANHRQGTELAVEHLLAQGHTRIGLLRYHENCWSDRERYAGYCEALRAAGVAPDPALVISREDWTAGGDLAPLLAKLSDLLLEDPTALVICSEDLLLPATHALYRLNRRVPDDLSVIGFECPEVSRYTQPPMTTVDGNTDLVAERVVQLVESLRENPDVPPQQVVLPASLISRHSVRAYSCPPSSAANPML